MMGKTSFRGCGLAFVLALAVADIYSDPLPYSLKWNRTDAKVERLNVSAVPQNMVWPGYQRPAHQSRAAYMTTVDSSGDAMELTVAFPSGVVERAATVFRARPLSRVLPFRRDGDSLHISFPGEGQYVLEFPGAAPELHVFVNKPFVYEPIPGDLYFGPGEHNAGIIRPKNGQTVCLAEGAVVYGMLYLDGVRDVRIIGRGILDSSRLVRTDKDWNVIQNLNSMRKGLGDPSKNLTQFWASSCTNVTVEGITLRDAPFWTVILYDGCRNFTFDNVKLVGQWRYNSDGFDICSSQNVTIRNSFVRSFDDCVVARGAGNLEREEATNGILVEDCVLWCDWGKNCEVCVGERDEVSVRNVTFRNCALANIAGCGCDVTAFRGGENSLIENIVFEGLEYDFVTPRYRQQMQDKSNPQEPFRYVKNGELRLLRIDMQRNYGGKKPTKKPSVHYRNIRFSRPKIVGESPDRVWLKVEESSSDLSVESVTLEGLPDNAEIEGSVVKTEGRVE